MPGVPPPRTFEPPQGHLNSTVYEQNTNAWRCPTPWDNAVVARPGSSVVPKKIFTCARWNRSIWKSQKSQDKVKINGWFFCIISTVEYVSKSLSCFFLYMLGSQIQTHCWTHWSFLWSIWKLQVAIPCVGIVPTPCCLTLINWLIDSLIQLRPIHHYLARSRKPFWCHSAHLLIFPFFPFVFQQFLHRLATTWCWTCQRRTSPRRPLPSIALRLRTWVGISHSVWVPTQWHKHRSDSVLGWKKWLENVTCVTCILPEMQRTA